MEPEPLITLERVTKQFKDASGRDFIAIKDISLTVRHGEFFTLIGPSGSGKSTVMRIMAGLEKETVGTVTRHPDVVPGKIGYVFQNFALMPWMTIEENVGFGLTANYVPESEKNERVREQLSRFKLEQFAKARPKDLSGGMRQRVGLARAFVMKPKVIFMDEPFSELDTFTAEELRQELLDLWAEEKPTIIMVTHLIPEAVELADRVGVFTPRPGKLEAMVINDLPRPRPKRTPEVFALEDKLTEIIKP
ncbi:MAG: hypothetical protein RI911_529 [Candidatus Parcubacteria bacterium]|jgi:NitT/TauT family transport system ATP-binding protein